MRHAHTDRRGSNAIELALILPLILTTVFAAVDYGWYYSQWFTMQTTVSHAARVGATAPQDDVESSVQNTPELEAEYAADARWASHAHGGSAMFAVSRNVGTLPELITVNGTVPYESLTGWFPMPSTIDITSTMVMQQQPGIDDPSWPPEPPVDPPGPKSKKSKKSKKGKTKAR